MMTMSNRENHVNTVEHVSEEHTARVAKVKHLQEKGISAWPASQEVTSTAQNAIDAFEKDPASTASYKIAGRLMLIRDHGKTFFAKLQDRSGTIQLYIKQDVIGIELFEEFKRDIDTGDIVFVHGTVFLTKTGEKTLRVESLKLLSKCLHPLPEKFHGLVDVEQRYRQRYLDLMVNPETAAKFRYRSRIIQEIRAFLQGHDFLEVETPMLHPIPGGAAAKPFTTHHNAYDMQLFLRIAPELYLKRLVVGGFERVFEINRNFRNEGISTRHNPEFTMLEFYMAHGNYLDGMSLTEQLIQDAVKKNFDSLEIPFQSHVLNFTAPFKRLTLEESLIEIGGLDKKDLQADTIKAMVKKHNIEIPGNPDHGIMLFSLFEALVEHKIIQPTFIIGYPLSISPLAKRDATNPNFAARFELFMVSMELANGFSELNDPFDQADRFKGQVASRNAGDQEAHHYDADYIHALEYGLPPTVGVGIGLDRLVMLLTNTPSIKDVILFPTLKPTHHE